MCIKNKTFSVTYTHFDSFLPNTYNIGMINTLLNKCFQICSNWSMLHWRLTFLREIFRNIVYPENFIDRCHILNRTHILNVKVPTVDKKPLQLVLPYLGTISLQTRTELQKSFKGVLNCCILQVIFKSQNKLCNNFCIKDPVVYKFHCGLHNESYYREYVSHLDVKTVEHIGISPLTNRGVQSRKDSAVCYHFINCSYSVTFEDFSVFCVTRIRSTS